VREDPGWGQLQRCQRDLVFTPLSEREVAPETKLFTSAGSRDGQCRLSRSTPLATA
jgi:hypothetical protein